MYVHKKRIISLSISLFAPLLHLAHLFLVLRPKHISIENLIALSKTINLLKQLDYSSLRNIFTGHSALSFFFKPDPTAAKLFDSLINFP